MPEEPEESDGEKAHDNEKEDGMTFVCPDCGSDDIGGKGPEWACGDCGEVFDALAERREKEDGMTMPDRVKLWPEGSIGWYRATTVPGMSAYKDTEYVRADIAEEMLTLLKAARDMEDPDLACHWLDQACRLIDKVQGRS